MNLVAQKLLAMVSFEVVKAIENFVVRFFGKPKIDSFCFSRTLHSASFETNMSLVAQKLLALVAFEDVKIFLKFFVNFGSTVLLKTTENCPKHSKNELYLQ